jgi:hypothetical protein
VPRCSQHSPRPFHRCDQTCPSQLGEWATSAPGPPRHGARGAAAEAVVVPSTCAPLRRRGSAVKTAQGQPAVQVPRGRADLRRGRAELGQVQRSTACCNASERVAAPHSMLQRHRSSCSAAQLVATQHSLLQHGIKPTRGKPRQHKHNCAHCFGCLRRKIGAALSHVPSLLGREYCADAEVCPPSGPT